MTSIDVESALKDFGSRPLGDVKVMMIEDDPLITDIVLTKLSKEGCIPYSALDGNEAIKLAEDFRPNVIILDLMLPGKQGEEVLAELKAHPELKTIPVIVFSNKDEASDMEAMKALGAAKYLIKASTDVQSIPDEIRSVLAMS